MNPSGDATGNSHSGRVDAGDPLFTVLIPTYNRPRLLAEAVQSVIDQSLSSWELIVIDDASPVPPSVPEDHRISLIRRPVNEGKASSLNAGLQLARGRYIAFLDDDDLWTEHRLANALRAHTDADVVGCRPGSTDSVTTSTATAKVTHLGHTRRISQLSNMGTISIRRELCPPLDPGYRASQDLEWKVRLLQHSPTVARVESEDFRYRHHSGPRHLNSVTARIDGQRALLRQHHEYFATESKERALRLRRIGLLHYRIGERWPAAKSALQSLRVAPHWEALELAARTILPRSWTLSRLRHRQSQQEGERHSPGGGAVD